MSKSPGKAAKWAARSERLAAALRENLKRRKAQVRQRDLGQDSAQHAAEKSEPDSPFQPEFRRNRTAP
jgi:hypothetical protein